MDWLEEEDHIIRIYQPSLEAIGIDFERDEIDDYLKTCSFDLEDRLRAIIAWYIYLLTNNKHLPDPNKIFIQAFQEEWKPRYWQDKYLEQLTSPGADSLITHRVRQKLSLISFFDNSRYQVKSNPVSVSFYEYYEGENRMIWQVNIDDFFSMSPKNLIDRYLDKSNIKGEEYLETLEKLRQQPITRYEEF
ncbi:MAG: hypothetical protein AAFO95_09700 [Cyanobacteria bacterium J06600_6]